MHGNIVPDRRGGRTGRRDHGQRRSRRRWPRLQILFRRCFKFFCAACAAEKIALPAVLDPGANRRRVHLHAAYRISLHQFLLSHFLRSPNLPLAEHDYIANAHGYIDDARMRNASYPCGTVPRLLNPESCYNQPMTLVEVTYELQSPLHPEQLRTLGLFANTYGLRRFRVDEQTNRLSFEYDASRLKESEVAHVLRMARIPVQRRV